MVTLDASRRTARPRTPEPIRLEDRQLLRQGQRSEDVRHVQGLLSQAGFPLRADGIFGPRTDRAVRGFQRAHGLQVDGIVGPQTAAALNAAVGAPVDRYRPGGTGGAAPTDAEQRRARTESAAAQLIRQNPAPRPGERRGAQRVINGVPVNHPPRGASTEAQFRHYARIVEAAGGQIRPGERHVLGLRGLDTDGTVRQTTARRAMQDSMVVLYRDAQGRAHVDRFDGSSYPGQRASGVSPDVTGDRVGDVGMIAEGTYRAHPNGNYKGKASWHVRTPGGSGRLPGVRDTNQDGRHGAAEWAASRRRGDTLTEVLFHRGNGHAVSSIGCLNVGEYDAFIQSLGSRGSRFDFTLVNAFADEPR